MATHVSLLQFADSLFPIGGYAHSFGLEYFVETGQVCNSQNVQEVLVAYLHGRAGPCDAVAVAIALRLAQRRDLEGCLALDQDLDAMIHVTESREASRQMGHQTARVAAELTEEQFLRDYLATVESSETPGHHPVAFGISGGVIGWNPELAASAFLFSTSSQIVGAATRLMPLGQLEAQKILWAVGPLIATLAHEALGKEPHDIWSFNPGLEVAGMGHAGLEQRLFRS